MGSSKTLGNWDLLLAQINRRRHLPQTRPEALAMLTDGVDFAVARFFPGTNATKTHIPTPTEILQLENHKTNALA